MARVNIMALADLENYLLNSLATVCPAVRRVTVRPLLQDPNGANWEVERIEGSLADRERSLLLIEVVEPVRHFVRLV